MTERRETDLPLRAAIVPVTPFQQNCAILWCTSTMTLSSPRKRTLTILTWRLTPKGITTLSGTTIQVQQPPITAFRADAGTGVQLRSFALASAGSSASIIDASTRVISMLIMLLRDEWKQGQSCLGRGAVNEFPR